jgi:hypothetical protein
MRQPGRAAPLDCPFIFHRDAQPIGDVRKAWQTACAAVGLSGRIVHDLRRSGVRHLFRAGIDPRVRDGAQPCAKSGSAGRLGGSLLYLPLVDWTFVPLCPRRGRWLHGPAAEEAGSQRWCGSSGSGRVARSVQDPVMATPLRARYLPVDAVP